MKTFSFAMALLLGVPTALLADVTKEDLRKLCAAGISEDLILNYVRSNGPLTQLSAGDLIDLKQAGASDSLLSSLLAAAPAAVATPAVIPPASSPDAPDVVLSAPATYSAVPAYDDACLSPCYYSDNWGTCDPSLPLGCVPYVGVYGGGTAAYRGGTRWGERRLVRNGLTWTRDSSPRVTGGQVLRRPAGGPGLQSQPVFRGGHVGSPSGSVHSGSSGGHAAGAGFGGGGHGGHR